MRLLSRFVLGCLVLTLSLSLNVTNVNAASKKKKKEVKREEHHVMSSGRKHPIKGADLLGRPGYFIADTANTPVQGQIMGAAHVQFNSLGSNFQIPFGAAFGITDKIQIHAATAFQANGFGSGLTNLTFGGKYGFGEISRGLDIAGGLDFLVGPLSGGNASLGFDPYGIVTYTFTDGLQLNGQLGVMVPGGGRSVPNPLYGILPNQPATLAIPAPPAYLQFNAGAAYPFDSELTGIAELAVNGYGNGGTPIVVGIRTGHDVQLQAFGGLDLAGTVGVVIGGGVALFSK